jgi:hypothetical protein
MEPGNPGGLTVEQMATSITVAVASFSQLLDPVPEGGEGYGAVYVASIRHWEDARDDMTARFGAEAANALIDMQRLAARLYGAGQPDLAALLSLLGDLRPIAADDKLLLVLMLALKTRLAEVVSNPAAALTRAITDPEVRQRVQSVMAATAERFGRPRPETPGIERTPGQGEATD